MFFIGALIGFGSILLSYLLFATDIVSFMYWALYYHF